MSVGSPLSPPLAPRTRRSFPWAQRLLRSYDLLEHGNAVDGPAVIVTPVTTIVLQPGQKAVLDMYKNVIIPLKE